MLLCDCCAGGGAPAAAAAARPEREQAGGAAGGDRRPGLADGPRALEELARAAAQLVRAAHAPLDPEARPEPPRAPHAQHRRVREYDVTSTNPRVQHTLYEYSIPVFGWM